MTRFTLTLQKSRVLQVSRKRDFRFTPASVKDAAVVIVNTSEGTLCPSAHGNSFVDGLLNQTMHAFQGFPGIKKLLYSR